MEIDILNDTIEDIDNINNNTIGYDSASENKKKIFKNSNVKETKFNIILTELNDHIEILNKEFRIIKAYIPKLISAYNHDMKTASKQVNKTTTKRKETGFLKKKKVPQKIQDYIGQGDLGKLTRNEVSSLIQKKLKNSENIYHPDKRVLRADDELIILFDLPENVNECTDPKDKINGLNLYNIHSKIATVYKKDEELIKSTSTIKTKKKKKRKKIKKI